MVSSVESNVELLKYSLFLVAKLVVKLNNQTNKQTIKLCEDSNWATLIFKMLEWERPEVGSNIAVLVCAC